MSGPTTAGSIVGNLKLDKSEWDRQRAEAKGEAAELGATKATVKVDANVGEALTKMEAVRAAQEKLGLASDRLKIAYQRLDEVQTKGGASESRLMSLHLAAAQAESAHEAATRGLANAQSKMAADADNAATEVKKLSQAVEAVDGASSSGGGGGTASRFALIAGAVAALIPLLAPLTGYAVGAAGALAGMGAAGVLAIFGIRDAMAAGTQAGNTFASGIQVLLGYFHQLAATAAASMLTTFNAALNALGDAMPSLNQQIGLFGKQLGGTTMSVLKGVLDAFRILNPLFVQAGVYVQQLAAGFQQWTSNGGLQQFTQMAIASFPQVAAALGSLVKGALDLVGALAPFGSILVTVIGLVGDLLTLVAPLVGNLVPLAAVVATVAGAFALWDKVSPVIEEVRIAIREFGVDLSTMMGVAGLAVAVVGYLASAFVNQRMQAMSAVAALQDYTSAVSEDNGVVGQSVKLQTAKWAADKQALGNYTTMGKSAVQVGRELGISAQTVSSAAMGQHAALMTVANSMQAYADNSANSTAKVAAMRAEFNNLVGALSDNKAKIDEQVKAYNDLAAAQGLSIITTQAELTAQQNLASTYGMSVSDMLAAESAQKQNADSAAATTRQLQLENDAATLLKNAFDLLNGTDLSVAQAQTAAAAATNSLTDSLKQNGTQIDGNSKAAVSNQQALQQKAAADQQAAEAIAKQTGSTVQGTAAFAASKAALVAQLTATGQLTPAIQALIDKYYAVPKTVQTKADLDAAAAIQRAQSLKSWLDSLTSKTIVVTVQTNAIGAPVGAGPTNTVRKFADGGTVGGSGGPKADTVSAYLSVGEEVTPNPQAGRYRPVLKALASDNISAARAALGGSGPVQVYVTSNGVDLSKYIDVKVMQGGTQLLAQANQEMNGGLV